jgi:p21-activated kinase 1
VTYSYQVGTNLSVATKQMDLDKHPKNDLIINEILVMRTLRHEKIVKLCRFVPLQERALGRDGVHSGLLTDVVTTKSMTEGQIAAFA